MLLRTLINEARQTVSTLYPEGEASGMVFALFEHLLGTKRHTHIVEPSYEVSAESVKLVEAALERLAAGEPLQYVIGSACFYGRDFKVSPSVLIPRPETELLCRTAIESYSGHRDARVLDMCTGSGCIAWTMALECPGAEVVAVDISDDALHVASSQDFVEEMKRTGAVAPTFLKADVLADVPSGDIFERRFDMILSNPPYVMNKEKSLMRANVLEHEPHLALFVSDDDPLVFYRAVARWASALLSPDGTGLVEINEALGPETAQVYLDAGFRSTEVLQDFSGRDRFVSFRR
jgi:release factor glutamine methyltransferase